MPHSVSNSAKMWRMLWAAGGVMMCATVSKTTSGRVHRPACPTAGSHTYIVITPFLNKKIIGWEHFFCFLTHSTSSISSARNLTDTKKSKVPNSFFSVQRQPANFSILSHGLDFLLICMINVLKRKNKQSPQCPPNNSRTMAASETSILRISWWPLRRQRSCGKDALYVGNDDATVRFSNLTSTACNTTLPIRTIETNKSGSPQIGKFGTRPPRPLELPSSFKPKKPRKSSQAFGPNEKSRSEEDAHSSLERAWTRWHTFYEKYSIILLLIVYISLARAYPELGAVYLMPEITSTWIAVCFIFVLSGLALETQAFSHARKQVKFNFIVQFYSFVVMSSVVYGASSILVSLGVLSDAMAQGMVICATLPSTTNSVTILTKAAGGDEAAAIFNSAFGNMIGVFLSPLLILFYVGVSANVDLIAVFYKLALRVILPVIVGQILRGSHSITRFVKKYKVYIRRAQIHAMLYISYSAFCREFHQKNGTQLTDILVLVAFTFFIYLGLTGLIWHLLGRIFPNQPRLRVMGFYGGTLKTVAIGIPLIDAMYDGDPDIAAYTVPLLVAYPMQLLVGSFFTPYLNKYVKAETARLGIKIEHSDVCDDSSDEDDDGKEKDLKHEPVHTRITAFFMHFSLTKPDIPGDEEVGLGWKLGKKKKGKNLEKERSRPGHNKLSKTKLQLQVTDMIVKASKKRNTRSSCSEVACETTEADVGNTSQQDDQTLTTSRASRDEELGVREQADHAAKDRNIDCYLAGNATSNSEVGLGDKKEEWVDEQASDEGALVQTCKALNMLSRRKLEALSGEEPHIESSDENRYLPSTLGWAAEEGHCSSVSMKNSSLLITGSFSEDSDDGEDWQDNHECHERDVMYEFITESEKLCLPEGTRCAGDCGLPFAKASDGRANGCVNVPTLEKPVLLCMHCSKLAVCYRCWKKSMSPKKPGKAIST